MKSCPHVPLLLLVRNGEKNGNNKLKIIYLVKLFSCVLQSCPRSFVTVYLLVPLACLTLLVLGYSVY